MATAAKAKVNKPSRLPEWDLDDLYSGTEDPRLTKALTEADLLSNRFAKDYAGKVEQLSGEKLAQAITEYEVLSELMGRIGTYAYLVYAKKTSDPAMKQEMEIMHKDMGDMMKQCQQMREKMGKMSGMMQQGGTDKQPAAASSGSNAEDHKKHH